MTITQIQHLLAFLGYYNMAVDGKWGPGSEAACRTFQKAAGLDVDGIPGKDTREALRKAVGEGLPIQEDPPDSDDALFWAGIKHFTPPEFTCSCCGLRNVDHRLVTICDDIRDRADVPFLISSGPRCPKHNAEVGGVYNSRHLAGPGLPGRAVDFRLKGKTAQETLALVKADGRLAYCYAIDETYVHMDII